MHPDQVEPDAAAVRELVATQFPQWAALPVRPVVSHGTVNALFRIGTDLVARFPLSPSTDPGAIEEEHAVVRALAPHVPTGVPEPVGIGRPGPGYAGVWSVSAWLEGVTADSAVVAGDPRFAGQLADVVRALHAVPVDAATARFGSRGGALADLDDDVREAIDGCAGLVDAVRLHEIWAQAVAAPPPRTRTWIHADLMPGNILVRDGSLSGVIDFETACVGDPAVDLMPAWNLLTGAARAEFRRGCDVDGATWLRGRGWAVLQAAPALPYYLISNPVMSDTARRTIDALAG